MILTLTQIKNILLNNPSKDLIAKGVKYHKEMRMHLYGENLEGHLKQINGFESDLLKKLRLDYAKSNKDLFARLGRNCDKVFSARGGSVYYNLQETGNKEAMVLSGDIRDGYSVRDWIKYYWLTHFKDDPMGLIFMEIGDGVEYPAGVSYPTYKPITDVYDYPAPKGSSLDYIVFNITSNDKKSLGLEADGIYYRLVDDAFDYVIKVANQEIQVISGLTLPNYFNKVPAILNSDIVAGQNENIRVGLFDDLLELANDFLIKGSIKITHNFKHGFPKYWEYADGCNDCKGTGMVDADTCKTCKGSGKSPMTKVSDIKLMQYPQSKEDPIITPNVAGYVSPDKFYWEMATTDLAVLEDVMNYTLWGKSDITQAQGPQPAGNAPKTATEVNDDNQPLVSRLTSISESAEKRHKFIIDYCIRINLSRPVYQGASINYGRRYLIFSEDEAWIRYSKARTDGASFAILNDLLRDYLETKYQGDPVSLAIQFKLISIEPFVHLTIAQCEPLVEIEMDYIKKLYFWEWVNSLQNNELLIYNLPMLRDSLTEYAKGIYQQLSDERQAQADFTLKQQTAAAAVANVRTGDKIDNLAA